LNTTETQRLRVKSQPVEFVIKTIKRLVDVKDVL